jgi:hypothetical protein
LTAHRFDFAFTFDPRSEPLDLFSRSIFCLRIGTRKPVFSSAICIAARSPHRYVWIRAQSRLDLSTTSITPHFTVVAAVLPENAGNRAREKSQEMKNYVFS